MKWVKKDEEIKMGKYHEEDLSLLSFMPIISRVYFLAERKRRRKYKRGNPLWAKKGKG